MAGWEMLLLDGADETDPELRVFYIGISTGLVLLAGLMSGLTLGLMSMDQVDLEVRFYAQPSPSTGPTHLQCMHGFADMGMIPRFCPGCKFFRTTVWPTATGQGKDFCGAGGSNNLASLLCCIACSAHMHRSSYAAGPPRRRSTPSA